jgi:hypothetical protein
MGSIYYSHGSARGPTKNLFLSFLGDNPDSTTYTGAIETAKEFGKRIYLETWNRGWSRAAKKVVMGDGVEWIWNLADQHVPGDVQIVDLYYARQHLWDLETKAMVNRAHRSPVQSACEVVCALFTARLSAYSRT